MVEWLWVLFCFFFTSFLTGNGHYSKELKQMISFSSVPKLIALGKKKYIIKKKKKKSRLNIQENVLAYFAAYVLHADNSICVRSVWNLQAVLTKFIVWNLYYFSFLFSCPWQLPFCPFCLLERLLEDILPSSMLWSYQPFFPYDNGFYITNRIPV